MATGDQYTVDINSVTSLKLGWQEGSEMVGQIAQKLGAIHGQLESSIPSALVEGLFGEVPLAECFARLAAAAKAASAVSQGLAQDTSTLQQNLNAYIKAEQEAEARLKAVQEKKHSAGTGHTTTSGTGSGSSSGGGGGGSSSGGGGGGGGGSSSGGGGTSVQPPGPAQYANQAQVETWINEAFKALEADGVPAGELNEAGVLTIIEHESSGNPNAINNWDSNAKAGDPSRGLMQVIGTTFDEYKLPGHDDIYSPVDNIIAGVRYALSRYGSIQNVPGVKSVNNGGPYVGY
jgi:Transglycosylase SLT domain